MKARYRTLPVLLVCCIVTLSGGAWAADGQDPQPANDPAAAIPGPTPGDELVARAVEAVESQPSVVAKLRQRVALFDQELMGSGAYLQGPPGTNRFRFELRMEGENQGSTLQHVSDGESLWIFRELDGKDTRVSKVDLARVLAALKQADDAKQANAPGLPSRGLGLGGLPKLLRGLSQDFQFGPAEPSALGELPVVVLRGVWRPARLATFLPEHKQAILAGESVDLSQLPAHLPEQIILTLGRDDLFPYRVEYLRRTKPGVLDRHGPEWRRVVLLEVFDVKLGAPIERGQFTYQPDDAAKLPDDTEVYLRSLGF